MTPPTAAGLLMTKNLVAATSGMRLLVAHALMERMAVRHLPVVNAANHLVGIVSDRDVRRVVRRAGDVWVCPELTVAEVMTPAPITAGPQTPLSAIAGLMLDHQIDSVPIVSNTELVGLITSADLIAVVAAARSAGP